MSKRAMPGKQVMLISGTRKGIGRFLAEYYAGKGYLVEGCSRRPAEWRADNYHHHAVDICDEIQVKRMMASINERHGRLDVVINNAGIGSMNHILLTPLTTVDAVMSTNLKGTFLLCRESVKLMKKRRFGRIVNFSSVAVPLHLEGEAVYAASKSAVVTFSRILAREVADFGITCNVIAPTPIQTDLIEGIARDKIDKIIGNLSIKRMGRCEDVANVIDFFIKPESEYVTGQVISLGGVS
jgi:3-oxoacyl-[acyl-carrier protein] reductase